MNDSPCVSHPGVSTLGFAANPAANRKGSPVSRLSQSANNRYFRSYYMQNVNWKKNHKNDLTVKRLTENYTDFRSLNLSQYTSAVVFVILACTQTLFYFSFRSFRKHQRARERSERHPYPLAPAVNKSPEFYFLSRALHGL